VMLLLHVVTAAATSFYGWLSAVVPAATSTSSSQNLLLPFSVVHT
jgi:hypothetical protein